MPRSQHTQHSEQNNYGTLTGFNLSQVHSAGQAVLVNWYKLQWKKSVNDWVRTAYDANDYDDNLLQFNPKNGK
jgi:hypothetical protein